MDLDVSVVLPVYNEAGHVREEVERIDRALAASSYRYEIVCVDDASSDGSAEVLRELAGEDVGARMRIITNVRNRGSGGARRVGTRESRGRIVVWTDVDLTYPNEEIPRLVAELEKGNWDQVIGARDTERGTLRFLRVPAKWFIRRLAQYLVETEIPDLNSGFRAFRADAGRQFLHLLPRGFSCVTTMTMSFLADDYAVGYVPISYAERAGESKFHWYRDTKRYLLQVVRMVLSYNPLRVFAPIGVFLLLFGTGKLAFDVITKDARLATNTLLILFAALQVLAIGLLADLVVRLSRQPERGP